MDKKDAQELLDKYASGLCSPQERAIVERWYAKESGLQQLPKIDQHDHTEAEIWDGVMHRSGLEAPRRAVSIKIWLSGAAAILIAVFTVLYFYNARSQKSEQINAQASIVLSPGSNKAVLTLADGSEIVLDEVKKGQVASEAGTVINKTGDGQLKYMPMQSNASAASNNYNSIKTPKGGQYHVVLPDGTEVWLNALSSIRFPAAFSGDLRQVEIAGEVYFEVKSNSAQPFIVKAGETTIRVLGTHFNVMAYGDEPGVSTTLVEGSVKVISGNHSKAIKPGQQATAANGNIAIENVDAEEAIAWKNGYFYFKDADVKMVMRQLSRWYDVDVEYAGKIPETAFSGKMYKNVDISKVLDMLSYFKIKYRITNSTRHQGKKTIVIY